MARRSENKRTFTKRMMKAILYVALVDLQFSYVLAFLGKEQIAEQLSGDICHTIIGVCLGYFMKSYFETKEEERNKRQDGGV